jgi:hypothetical protein
MVRSSQTNKKDDYFAQTPERRGLMPFVCPGNFSLAAVIPVRLSTLREEWQCLICSPSPQRGTGMSICHLCLKLTLRTMGYWPMRLSRDDKGIGEQYHTNRYKRSFVKTESATVQRQLRADGVILATQEAEIRRIKVLSQPRQTVCKTLI